MNLPAAWIVELAKDGHDAIHWKSVGAANASDDEILNWAAREDTIVLTADLDFGTAIATRALAAPSVVQIRDPSTDPDQIGSAVRSAIRAAGNDLARGAILTVNRSQARFRPGPQALPMDEN